MTSLGWWFLSPRTARHWQWEKRAGLMRPQSSEGPLSICENSTENSNHEDHSNTDTEDPALGSLLIIYTIQLHLHGFLTSRWCFWLSGTAALIYHHRTTNLRPEILGDCSPKNNSHAPERTCFLQEGTDCCGINVNMSRQWVIKMCSVRCLGGS